MEGNKLFSHPNDIPDLDEIDDSTLDISIHGNYEKSMQRMNSEIFRQRSIDKLRHNNREQYDKEMKSKSRMDRSVANTLTNQSKNNQNEIKELIMENNKINNENQVKNNEQLLNGMKGLFEELFKNLSQEKNINVQPNIEKKCNYCDKILNSINELEIHINQKHKNYILANINCKICQYTTQNENEI